MVDFDFPAYHRVKIKESKKRDKYLDLASELKITPKTMKYEADGGINCGWFTWEIPKALVMGPEDFEIRGQVETIQITALLRLTRILRKVLETWGELLFSNSSGKSSANAGVENLSKE